MQKNKLLLPIIFFLSIALTNSCLRDKAKGLKSKNSIAVATDVRGTWTIGSHIKTTISAIAANSNNFFIGGGDSVYVSFNNCATWQVINSSNPINTNCILTKDNNIFIGGSIPINLGDFKALLFKCDNNGNNLTNINLGTMGSNNLSGNILFSLASMDSIMFASLYGVYKTVNNGNSWTVVNNGVPQWRSNSYYGMLSFAVIDSLIFGSTGGSSNNSTQYLYSSKDKGLSWIATNNGLPKTAIRKLAARGSTIFAGSLVGLFVSSDMGNNWSKVGNGFPVEDDILDISISGSNILVNCYYNGLYLSTDNGYSWKHIIEIPSTPSISKIVVKNDIIYAAGAIITYSGETASINYGAVWKCPISSLK